MSAASLSSTLGIPHPPPPSLAGLGLNPHGIPPHILAAQRVGMMPGKSNSTDYTRYFKRFGRLPDQRAVVFEDLDLF